MVKADATRNYYADLELPSDASYDDIKRSYKKLAFKYHPDRNAGREAEVVPKFQAIQAAFEILNDPAQRTKYDSDRRKMGASANPFRPNVPPRSHNPYTTATRDFSQYPPPPRRTEPRYGYDYARTSASTARQRQQQQQQQPQSQQQPQTNADRFARFPRPPTAQRPSAQDDAEARARNFSAWQHMASGKPKPTSDNEFVKAQAQAQAQAQNAYGYYSPNAGPPPGVKRSQTTKNPRKTGFDPQTPGADEPQAARASAYYTSSRYNPRPFPNRMSSEMPPNASSGDDDVPFNEGRDRPRAPYHNLGGERTDFSADLKRSASTRNSPSRPNSSGLPGHHSDQGHRPHRSASPVRRRPFSEVPNPSNTNTPPKQTRPKQGGNATRPFLGMYDSSDEDEDAVPRKNGANKVSGSPGKNTGAANGGINSGYPAERPQPSIFNVTTPNDTLRKGGPEFKSRSAENISTEFPANGFNGKFEGNPDYFGAQATSERKGSRSRTSPVRGRTQVRPVQVTPTQQAQMPPPPPPPPQNPPVITPAAPQNIPSNMPPLNTTNLPSENPQPVKFSPAEWEQMFQKASFDYQPPMNPSSPTKGPRRVKTPKSRKATSIPATVPKPATVSDAPDDGRASSSSNGSTETVNSADSSAMDIDIEMPAAANGQTSPEASKGARKVSTTPSRPEWREARPTTDIPKQPAFQSSAQPDSSFGLNVLKNVAPFAPGQGGVDKLGDLGTALPFTSGTSTKHPSQNETTTAFDMPRPPKPPVEPTRLTRSAWADYIQRMTAYLSEWAKFNAAMVKRFDARQAWVECLADKFTGSHGWVGALGDTKDGGFQAYIDALREDERAREHWSAACERHKVAMEKCAALRDRVLKAGDLPMV